MSELVGEDAYFLVDKSERELIDGFRHLSQEEREMALRIIQSLEKSPPKKDQDEG